MVRSKFPYFHSGFLKRFHAPTRSKTRVVPQSKNILLHEIARFSAETLPAQKEEVYIFRNPVPLTQKGAATLFGTLRVQKKKKDGQLNKFNIYFPTSKEDSFIF